MLNGAREIVWRVLGFGWECPGWFVARADVDAAEKDGMETKRESGREHVR